MKKVEDMYLRALAEKYKARGAKQKSTLDTFKNLEFCAGIKERWKKLESCMCEQWTGTKRSACGAQAAFLHKMKYG